MREGVEGDTKRKMWSERERESDREKGVGKDERW